MVCDIEGYEKFLVGNEYGALINCRQIIIELHETRIDTHEVSVVSMFDLIQRKHGFHVVDKYQGRGIGVYVFEK